MPGDVPRGVEVLIKKAAVDPAFKKMLLEKRAGAAEAIGLKLNAAEEAMLAAVPLPQLEAIVAHTRVAPKFRPAFLGYAAGAMLAVLGSATLLSDSEVIRNDETKRPPAKFSPKNNAGKRRLPGNAVKETSYSRVYRLTGGVGGGGSAGMRGDRPPEAESRPETAPAKSGRESRRNQPRHRHCMGATADVHGDSGREQPAPYLITFESRVSGGRSYRSAGSLRDQIKKRLPGIQNAYDAAVEDNPSLGGGKITARFTVDPEGRVVEAEIADDTLGDVALRSLILSRVRSWKFPAAGQADVVVEYPFVFIAEKG